MSPKAKVGISLYTYGADIRYGKMTIRECIEHAASLNVEGVELVDKQHIPNYPHPSIYDLQELRDYIESFGMTVSCYSTYVDVMIHADRWATREEQIRQILDDIAEARVLGAKVCRPTIFPSWGYHRTDSAEELPELPKLYKNFKLEVKQIIMEVLPTLKKYDVVWGTEIHAPMPPEEILDLIKQVDDDHVGLIPDFSAWQTKGVLGTEGLGYGMATPGKLKDCMPYTKHVHAKAQIFDENGEEPSTPYDKLIPIIKESTFSGYISAEFEGWMGGEDLDSKKIAETHVNLIRRYL